MLKERLMSIFRQLKLSDWRDQDTRARLLEVCTIDLRRAEEDEIDRQIEEVIWQLFYEKYFPQYALPDDVNTYQFAMSFEGIIKIFEHYPDLDFLGSYYDDTEILLAILTQTDSQMEFSSERLKNDLDFALRAVSLDGTAYQFFSDEVKENLAVKLAAVKNSAAVLMDMVDDDLNNEEIILAAITGQYPDYFIDFDFYAGEQAHFLYNKKVMLATVQFFGLFLKDVSLRLRQDPEVIEAACKQNSDARVYALPPNNAFSETIVKASDEVLKNISWSDWRLAHQLRVQDTLLCKFELGPVHLDRLKEAIWQRYYLICFGRETLPEGVRSYEAAFSPEGLKALFDENPDCYLEIPKDFEKDTFMDDDAIVFAMVRPEENRHLINLASDRLKASKPFAFLVNCTGLPVLQEEATKVLNTECLVLAPQSLFNQNAGYIASGSESDSEESDYKRFKTD